MDLAQHGLSLESAAESYILLSIGDGLVAQIPSLLLAIATAIIVTRVSTTQDMAKHIGHQVSLFRAWVPVAGVLLLIGFVPGMPNFLFLFAAAAAGLTAFFLRNYNPQDDETANDASGTAVVGGSPIKEVLSKTAVKFPHLIR